MSATHRFVSEPDGFGGMRHVLRPASDTPPAPRGRRRRVVPDPIRNARDDSSAQTLRQFIERIEGVDSELAELAADKADIVSELKSQGYSHRAVATIIARRKKEKHVLDEDDAILETYQAALGLP